MFYEFAQNNKDIHYFAAIKLFEKIPVSYTHLKEQEKTTDIRRKDRTGQKFQTYR